MLSGSDDPLVTSVCVCVCNPVPTEGQYLLPPSASTLLLLFLVSVCTHLFEPCGRQSFFSIFFPLSSERSLCVCPRAGNGLRQGEMLWLSGEREGRILAVCVIAGCGPVPTLHITLVYLRKHKNSSWSWKYFSLVSKLNGNLIWLFQNKMPKIFLT